MNKTLNIIQEQIDELLLKASKKNKIVKIEPFRFRMVKRNQLFQFDFHDGNLNNYNDDTIQKSFFTKILNRITHLQKLGKEIRYNQECLHLINSEGFEDEIKLLIFNYICSKYKQKLPIDIDETTKTITMSSELKNGCFGYELDLTFVSEERIGLSLTLENNLLQVAYISDIEKNNVIEVLSGINSNRIEFLGWKNL